MSGTTMLNHTDGFARPFGLLPSPARRERGRGRGHGMSGTTMLDHTDGFAGCGRLLYHPSPLPSPHEGRGSQDTSVCVHLGVARGGGR
ncbi:hypothetical protein D9X30_2107 [Cupriavidus sp. U2]|nr:hypothetical protein D9X30_2107 [Cupriavidus sp. U2]